jgi:serine/threonine protein kinase
VQLQELAGSRQLAAADMLLRQGAPRWQMAASIAGLFQESIQEPPRLVTGLPGLDSSDILLGDTAPTPEGPLSRKGLKVCANFSLTLGDFKIIRKVGTGGMGAVYLAHQRSENRPVALKVLAEKYADNENFVNRFHREITILASLDHPNIVKFTGAGQEKGIPFLTMEFIEGFSSTFLVRHHGKLAVGDALHILRKSAMALDYACAHKVIHRDINPENIMITRRGEIKIGDLGLAKSLDPSLWDSNLDLTDTGTGMGSPKYMAPEQTHNAKMADHRSDIFSLGAVLYFFLVGEEPFKGTTGSELLRAKEKRILTPARRLNKEIPPRLELMIDKMLANEPKYRYQTYADLLKDLDSLGLAHERLSCDPAQIANAFQGLPIHDLVEILLIDDDLDDVRLARQALEENKIHSNLVAVNDGAEARAYLRREGKFQLAPPPSLIIFGSKLNPADSMLTLEEIKVSDRLSNVPVVLLAKSAEVGRYFESRGYNVKLLVQLPNDPSQLDKFFSSIQGLRLTVMELSASG